MISDDLFIFFTVWMIYSFYMAVPKEEEVQPLNLLYGLFATGLAWTNAQMLLGNNILIETTNYATSGVYYNYYMVFMIISGAITAYMSVMFAMGLFGDDDDE